MAATAGSASRSCCLLDVMNAGELALGAALPALQAAAGGADELAGALGIVGIASVEDCAAVDEFAGALGVVGIASAEDCVAIVARAVEPAVPALHSSRLPPGPTVPR